MYGGEVFAGDAWQVLTQRPVLLAYFAVCWFTAFLYLPIISIVRAHRPTPPQMIECSGRIENIAKRLGEAPAGDGKLARLAMLPGSEP